MSQKKNIRVYFCGFDGGEEYNKNNIFLTILKKRYVVQIDKYNPQFVFYYQYNYDYLNYSNAIKIYYTQEAISPNFNECDYAIGYENINFGERYFRYPYRNRNRVRTNTVREYIDDESALQRRFCNFVYHNDFAGEGSLLRKNFCKMLMDYKQVDCPGRVLNNCFLGKEIPSRYAENFVSGKLEFIKKYKFTIAFENYAKDGYNSEKIFHPLQVCSIPIYYGDPSIGKDYNTNAFINVNDFSSLKEVVDYVKYLDTNDEEYLKMLHTVPFDWSDLDKTDHLLEEFIYNIIENGHIYNKRQIFGLGSLTNLSCEALLNLAYESFSNGKIELSKLAALTCLQLDTPLRYSKLSFVSHFPNVNIYELLMNLYENDSDSLFLVLMERASVLINRPYVYVEDLNELCQIAKYLKKMLKLNEANIICEYIINKDSELTKIEI